MSKMENYLIIYSTIINLFFTITAIPFPLRSTFTTDTFIEFACSTYRDGKTCSKMIIISTKTIPYVTIKNIEAVVGISSFLL